MSTDLLDSVYGIGGFTSHAAATIRWHYTFGTGPSDWVSGVNLMRVRDGEIVEALGYSKTAGEVPLATDTGLDD